jgi:hypothetical protein
MDVSTIRLSSIPPLDELELPLIGNCMLNIVFRGPGPNDHLVRAYLANFVRVTDRSIQSYNRARRSLENYFSNDQRLLPIVEALSEFEDCLHNARRALRFFERLRTHPQGSPGLDDGVMTSAIGR